MTVVLLGGEPGTFDAPVNSGRVIVGMSLESSAGVVDLLSFPYRMTSFVGFSGGDADIDEDALPGVDGSYVVGEDTDRAGLTLSSVELDVSVLVSATTSMQTSSAVEELRRILASRRYGAATLTVTRSSGEARSIPVRHVPKREDFAPMRQGGNLRPVVLRLLAPSPFWQGVPGSAGPWGVGGGGGGGMPMGMPAGMASARVLGEANPVLVGGDEITYPTLQVDAPFTTITVARSDGRGYTLTAPDPQASGSVFVRHDPTSVLGGRQVQGPDGSSWARYLNDGADLFELRPGVESMTVTVTGGGPATQARLTWPTLYWSAV